MAISARPAKEGNLLYRESDATSSYYQRGKGTPLGINVVFEDGEYHSVAAAPPDKPPSYGPFNGLENSVGVKGIPGASNENYIDGSLYRPGDKVAPRRGIIFEITQ